MPSERVEWLRRRVASAAALLLVAGMLPGCGKISARRSLKAGNAAYKDNRWELALSSYSQVPDGIPERMHALLGTAYVHMAQFRPGSTRPDNLQHVADGVKAFDAYIKLRPADSKDTNLPDAEQVTGWVLEMLIGAEQYPEAISRMEAELKIKPNDPAMLRGIAQAYEKWGKLVEAVSYYRKWAATFPKDPAPHVAIAAFCWNVSYRRSQALEPLERNRWIDTGYNSAEAALAIEPAHFEGMTYQQLLLRERAKMRVDPDAIAGLLDRASVILAKVSEIRKKKKEAEEAEKKARGTASPGPGTPAAGTPAAGTPAAGTPAASVPSGGAS